MVKTKSNNEQPDAVQAETVEIPVDVLEELKAYKAMFEKLPDNLKYYLCNLDRDCMIVRRIGQPYYGRFTGFEAEVKSIKAVFQHDYKDYEKKKSIREIRESVVAMSAVIDVQFLHDRQEEDYE